MGRSQETFNKKEVRNKKEKKRKEKEKRRLERKNSDKSSSLDDMIAYVDENGRLSSTPPDENKKKEVKAEDIAINVPKSVDEPEEIEHKGTIAYFNDSKGYGFIRDLKSRDSVFFHVNDTLEEIKEGNLVTFETEQGVKSLKAIKVKLSK